MQAFEKLPDWLQDLWKDNAPLARRIEHYFDEQDRILRACLGTLGDDEELPPWVRWDSLDNDKITIIELEDTGKIVGRYSEDDYAQFVNWEAIVYTPHVSLHERSLQRRPHE